MTEHEAEALVARLTRVWDIDHTTIDANREAPYFWFNGNTVKGMQFSYNQEFNLLIDHVLFARFEEGDETGRLEWGAGVGLSQPIPPDVRRNQERYEAFARQWLPIFRRGCWLSGCDIEASVHEKAEWMQGFSQEELQAWNLKT